LPSLTASPAISRLSPPPWIPIWSSSQTITHTPISCSDTVFRPFERSRETPDRSSSSLACFGLGDSRRRDPILHTLSAQQMPLVGARTRAAMIMEAPSDVIRAPQHTAGYPQYRGTDKTPLFGKDAPGLCGPERINSSNLGCRDSTASRHLGCICWPLRGRRR
jgi:hypothetical protein